MPSYSDTPDAKAKRAQRRAMRSNQANDVLAERARLIAFWRRCSQTNPGYCPYKGAWWHSFVCSPSFRHLLMPALRDRLQARGRAESQRYAAELREHGRQWAQRKAERAAAKARARRPQLDMLDAI